jgi:hypothetical protein
VLNLLQYNIIGLACVSWKQLEVKCMRKLVRLSLAIGGFLIVTSLILTGAIFLILLNMIDVSVLADPATTSVLTMLFLAIGVLDFIAGILLLMKK